MRKLEVQDVDIMRIAVQQEIIRSENSRYDHRLHGVLLVCSGLSCYDVAGLFGQSPRTVQYWIRKFEESGFAGLEEKQRTGRPSTLDKAVYKAIGKDLRQSPRQLAYTQNLWDGKLLSHHLANVYKTHLGERQCRRLFREMGFRRRKPRPVIAKADPDAQQRYKRTPEAG